MSKSNINPLSKSYMCGVDPVNDSTNIVTSLIINDSIMFFRKSDITISISKPDIIPTIKFLKTKK